MGRKRINVDLHEPLPQGLNKHRQQYRARFPGLPWQYFGTDYAEAIKGFKAWQREGGDSTSTAWLLDLFTGVVCAGKVKAGTLSPRTRKDYGKDAETLKGYIGHIPYAKLEPKHIADFRDSRAQIAPRHIRNEMACGSAAFAWAVESGKRVANPFLEVRRPRKTRRERLITHDEYLTVYKRAIPSVQRAMTLAVRTLALPDDLLGFGPRNIIRAPDGKRLLRFERNKVKGAWVEVEILGELARVIDEALADAVVRETFVHKSDGKRYTRDGIGAMFRRYCVGTALRAADPIVADFGLRDLRAKGATDMYRAGADLKVVQRLLGHSSVRTTEIYIKELLPEPVRPNEVPIVAQSK